MCSAHTEAKCRDICKRNFTIKGVFPFADLRKDVQCCRGNGDRGDETDICRDGECRLNDGEYVLLRNKFNILHNVL